MPPKKKRPSNKELLIYWTQVGLHQQLWIADIIQALGAPLLPGATNEIRRNLSPNHFRAWREEGVPAELINGLLAACAEEQATRAKIAARMRGEMTRRLIDLLGGRLGRQDSLSENIKQIQRVFMVEKVSSFSDGPEEREDRKSDAFEDAWKALCDVTQRLIEESWPLPVGKNEFETKLFEIWQPQVLPALRAWLAILVAPDAVDYIPAKVKSKNIDRWRYANRKKRRGKEVQLDENVELELMSSGHSNKSAEEEANFRELVRTIYESAAELGPKTERAIDLIIRGAKQNEAAEVCGLPKQTLNEHLGKIQERIIKIREK